MTTKYRLPVKFGQTCPTQQSHGLFATAKFLVMIPILKKWISHLIFLGTSTSWLRSFNLCLF